MQTIALPTNILKAVVISILALAMSLAAPLSVNARHAAPAPPTNLSDSIWRTNPGIHTLFWTASSSPTNYYVIYRDGVRVDQTTNTNYQLNNSTQYSGNYTVRAVDNTHGYEMQSSDSNSVYVTLGYLWLTNGSPWNSCFTPGAPTPPGPYDGCFAAGSAMYALRNVNVKYSASAVRSGNTWIRVDYRQKFAQLPTGYTKYDVNVIVGAGSNWQYVTTLQLPAGAPEEPKSVTMPMNIPIDHPGEIELQWVNDVSNGSGDSNLQISYIQLNRP